MSTTHPFVGARFHDPMTKLETWRQADHSYRSYDINRDVRFGWQVYLYSTRRGGVGVYSGVYGYLSKAVEMGLHAWHQPRRKRGAS